MERLAELLARLAALTEIERAELDEILAELTGPILDSVTEAGNTPAAIEALAQIADAVDAIHGEIEGREAREAEQAEQAEALLARIRAASEPDPDDDPEGEEEPVVPADPDDPVHAPDPEAPAQPEAKVPVAAAARPAAARRPATTRPRAAKTGFAALGLTASANNGAGVAPGTVFETSQDFGRALVEAVNRSGKYTGGGEEHVVVASMKLPESAFGARTLSLDPVETARKLREFNQAIPLVASGAPEAAALTAAGGICAPISMSRAMPVLGSKARPVRDRLMERFGATEGGIRTLPAPDLADITAANPNGVSVWTNAIDTAWTGTTPNDQTKPCVELDCPTPVETLVEAIVQCMTYSNFRARFFPEQIDAWMDLLGVLTARFAEGRLLDKMRSVSLGLTSAANISTVPDVLSTMLRVKAGYRDRYRLDADATFTWGVPHWFADLMITDLIRRMPAHSTHEADLAVSEATLAAILRAHGLTMVPYLDSSAAGDQEMPAQAAGPVVNYPAAAETFFYPSGAWKFLDGGELNLGIVRDSTLNASNRVKFFAETFEGAHFDGPESLRVTLTTIAKGTAGALTTITA